MNIQFEKKADALVFKLEGSLSIGENKEFEEYVTKHLASGANNVIIDMEKIVSIDSSGIGSLAFVQDNVKSDGGQVRLTGLNEELRAIFKKSKLDKYFVFLD